MEEKAFAFYDTRFEQLANESEDFVKKQAANGLKRYTRLMKITEEIGKSYATYGVYVIYFGSNSEKPKYVGYSSDIKNRIKNNLLNGDEKSHTLINKLISVHKPWTAEDALTFLKKNASVMLLSFKTEYFARLVEKALIEAFDTPDYNNVLKKIENDSTLKAKISESDFASGN